MTRPVNNLDLNPTENLWGKLHENINSYETHKDDCLKKISKFLMPLTTCMSFKEHGEMATSKGDAYESFEILDQFLISLIEN